MSTGAIVAIVVGAIVLLGLAVVLVSKTRGRRRESRRAQAGEIRREAQVRGAQAERHQAEAEERAARARKEQALADEQAAHAERTKRFARERGEEADQLDPDADTREGEQEVRGRR